jgi:hypothetical protein
MLVVVFSGVSFDKKMFMSKAKEQKMFADIIRQQQSGLSQKAWCEQNGIAYSSFHYWYRRFRNDQTGKGQVTGDGFVQLMVQDRPTGTPWCELVLGNGQKLFFHQPIAVEFIRGLLD